VHIIGSTWVYINTMQLITARDGHRDGVLDGAGGGAHFKCSIDSQLLEVQGERRVCNNKLGRVEAVAKGKAAMEALGSATSCKDISYQLGRISA
jgi:hypothetical protein